MRILKDCWKEDWECGAFANKLGFSFFPLSDIALISERGKYSSTPKSEKFIDAFKFNSRKSLNNTKLDQKWNIEILFSIQGCDDKKEDH